MTPVHAHSDDVRNQDGLTQVNSSPSETIRLGQEAMARQRRAWDDWIAIAKALDEGRAEVMRDVHTNQPRGRRYERAMAEWLVAKGFKEIDKGVRSRLLECLRHREAIERWRSERLTDGERFRFNHPNGVLRRWQKSIAPEASDPEPKLSPVAKLKESLAALDEENHKLRREIERGGGDIWSPEDHNRDIARVMLDKLGPTRWQKIVVEAEKLIAAGAEKEAAAGLPQPTKRKGRRTPDDFAAEMKARRAIP